MVHDRWCNLLEPCQSPEAPLCPLQEVTLKNGIWYGDEPICKNELFQNLSWVKKQRIIASLGLTAEDGFFTVKMLNSLRFIGKNLKGANPEMANAEVKWFYNRRARRTESQRRKRKKINNNADNTLHCLNLF